jgi:DNA modification methylase
MSRPIKNNSSEGQAVCDPFLGSGTTLIAAEQTGRNCYGMEIEPKYCDVIVSRYVNLTGNKTVKLNGKEIVWQSEELKKAV